MPLGRSNMLKGAGLGQAAGPLNGGSQAVRIHQAPLEWLEARGRQMGILGRYRG